MVSFLLQWNCEVSFLHFFLVTNTIKNTTTTTTKYFISPHGYYHTHADKYTDKCCWGAGGPK